MAPRSSDIVHDAAQTLRELQATAHTEGHEHLSRASGILAARYEALAAQLSTPGNLQRKRASTRLDAHRT